jgi:hypothetical protein
MTKLNQQGSALTETCFALIVFQVILAVAIPAVYLSFAHLWIQFQSQEALTCLASQKSPVECAQKFTSEVERALPFGSFSIQSLNANGSSIDYKLGSHFHFTLVQKLGADRG